MDVYGSRWGTLLRFVEAFRAFRLYFFPRSSSFFIRRRYNVDHYFKRSFLKPIFFFWRSRNLQDSRPPPSPQLEEGGSVEIYPLKSPQEPVLPDWGKLGDPKSITPNPVVHPLCPSVKSAHGCYYREGWSPSSFCPFLSFNVRQCHVCDRQRSRRSVAFVGKSRAVSGFISGLRVTYWLFAEWKKQSALPNVAVLPPPLSNIRRRSLVSFVAFSAFIFIPSAT